MTVYSATQMNRAAMRARKIFHVQPDARMNDLRERPGGRLGEIFFNLHQRIFAAARRRASSCATFRGPQLLRCFAAAGGNWQSETKRKRDQNCAQAHQNKCEAMLRSMIIVS